MIGIFNLVKRLPKSKFFAMSGYKGDGVSRFGKIVAYSLKAIGSHVTLSFGHQGENTKEVFRTYRLARCQNPQAFSH